MGTVSTGLSIDSPGAGRGKLAAGIGRAEGRARAAAAAFSALLACPACRSGDIQLAPQADNITCQGCARQFPVFACGDARIPWLFPDPDSARLEWKARYNGFLHSNSAELERLRRARDRKGNSKTGQRRISRLLQAREQYRNQVTGVLKPLGLEGIDWPADATDLLHCRLPKSQGLSSYTSNVFRDWVWNNGENGALLDAVDDVLTVDQRANIGSVLTLGAGSCRLPYDMHLRYSPAVSVALDLNPLLLHIAGHVIQGERVPLFEFPVAPLNEASYAVLQECYAPVPIQDGSFHYVLADTMNLPFNGESFDTVVTPWLIDIIPQNLKSLIPHVNRALKPGGVWTNTGSLAFFHKDESWRYSEEEVLELLEQSGFEVVAAKRQSVPYLQSPHCSHGRTEKILSFSAKKTHTINCPAAASELPKWILDTSRPVPSSTESAVSASNHLLQAQVLAAIDGKRTINQIGRLVARQYGLGKKETIHAVKRILVDAWDEMSVVDSSTDI